MATMMRTVNDRIAWWKRSKMRCKVKVCVYSEPQVEPQEPQIENKEQENNHAS